jgi:hypothetical protein
MLWSDDKLTYTIYYYFKKEKSGVMMWQEKVTKDMFYLFLCEEKV